MIFNKLNLIFHKFIKTFDQVFEAIFCDESKVSDQIINLNPESLKKIAYVNYLNTGIISLFPYDNKIIKDIIYSIKNKHNTKAVDLISMVASDLLYEEISELGLIENFDKPIIVSVPSNKKSYLNRGYSPSSLIALSISKYMPDILFIKNILYKNKETVPQKTLAKTDRLKNVKYTMSVNKRHINKMHQRNIILIDDVTTTGATLQEAKRALLEAGARKVLCVALSH